MTFDVNAFIAALKPTPADQLARGRRFSLSAGAAERLARVIERESIEAEEPEPAHVFLSMMGVTVPAETARDANFPEDFGKIGSA